MPTDTIATDVIKVSLRDWPVPWGASLGDWLGEIEVDLPSKSPWPQLNLLGIVASHDAKHDPLAAWWELALESALRHAKRSHRMVFFSAATPYADRLRHACERFRLPYLLLGCRDAKGGASLGLMRNQSTAILRCVGNPLPNRSDMMDLRLEDRAVSILSHQLFGLHVRHGGKIARLFEARLAEPNIIPGSTIVAIREENIRSARDRSARKRSASAAWHLSEQGAVLWMRRNTSHSMEYDAKKKGTTLGCKSRRRGATWMPFGSASRRLLISHDFLIHFTRARQGSWPDQSQSHLFDEAIQLDWEPQNGPLDSLHRILSSQRLIASSYLRRGNIRTVCFTGQCLQTMCDQKGFQSHLGRWDWEPYGIAIRRTWMENHGARPVQYLSRSEINAMPQEQQAFTQPLQKDDSHRDWRIEREWRVKDDIRLCQIPADQAFVFVRRRSEASILSSLSRWPIVFVDVESRN